MMLGYILAAIMVIFFIIILMKEGRPPSPGAMIILFTLFAGTVSAQSSGLNKYRVTSDYFVKNNNQMFVDHNKSSMFVKFPNNVKPVQNTSGTVFIQSSKNQSFITVYRPTNNYQKGSYNVRNVIKFK